ncbi:hypothetical protein A1D31_22235 [Bradyrhizobium liaoningense]|nr:hypothetical protein A1D31_22235 [Bradyrhizobium liaoningense]
MARGSGVVVKPRGAGAETLQLLEAALGPNSMIRVTFDVTPEQFFQLLGSMTGPIQMIKGRTRTMLELEQVLKIVPVSKSTLLRMLAEERFPRGHYISPNRRVWYEDDILKWQDQLLNNQTDSLRKKRDRPKDIELKAKRVSSKKRTAKRKQAKKKKARRR